MNVENYKFYFAFFSVEFYIHVLGQQDVKFTLHHGQNTKNTIGQRVRETERESNNNNVTTEQVRRRCGVYTTRLFDCLYIGYFCGCDCGCDCVWADSAPVVCWWLWWLWCLCWRWWLAWMTSLWLTCALDRRPRRRSWALRHDCPAPPYYRDRSLDRRHRRRRVWPCCRDQPPHHSRPAAVATVMVMVRAMARAWPNHNPTCPAHVQSPCCWAISIWANSVLFFARGKLQFVLLLVDCLIGWFVDWWVEIDCWVAVV